MKPLLVEQSFMGVFKSFLLKSKNFDSALKDAAEAMVQTGRMTRQQVDNAISLIKSQSELVSDIKKTYVSGKIKPSSIDDLRLQNKIDDLISSTNSKDLGDFINNLKTITQKDVNAITSNYIKSMIKGNKFVKMQEAYDKHWRPYVKKMLRETYDNTDKMLNLSDLEKLYMIPNVEYVERFIENYKQVLDSDLAKNKITRATYDLRMQSIDNATIDELIDFFNMKFNYKNDPEIEKIIDEYRVSGRIDDSASEINTPKYGDGDYDLTIEKDKIFRSPKDGDAIDNVTDDVIDDVIEDEPKNFFERYGEDMDFDLMKAMNALSEASDNTGNKNLQKIINLLKSNKKITNEMLQGFESDLKLLKNDSYIEKLKSELLNPTGKKLNFLEAFFRSKVEPIVKIWWEMWTPIRLKSLANKNGYDGLSFDFFSDRFKKDLQNILLKTKSQTISSPASVGELQRLKDSFLRLMTPSKEMELTYEQLWGDLEGYLKNNLDPKSKVKWDNLVTQMKNEKGSKWRWLTFNEIIPSFGKTVDDSLSKGTKGATVTQSMTSKFLMSLLETLKGPLISSYLTGNFRTPKQMMQFLMENGYATKGVPIQIGKARLPIIELSAAGSNFISNMIVKRIIWPAAIATGYTTLLEAAEQKLNVDIDEKNALSTWFNSFTDYVLNVDNDDMKKTIKSNEIKKILGKDISDVLLFLGYYGDDEKRRSPIYNWYKQSFLQSVPSPATNDIIDAIGFFTQSKRTKEEEKEDRRKFEEEQKNRAETIKNKGIDKARTEYNDMQLKLWQELPSTEQIKILDKHGYSKLKEKLDLGNYGDSLSYDDCQFVFRSIAANPKVTKDVPESEWPKSPDATLALKGGDKYYKLVPVLRDNDPEGIYGKYPNLDDKFAWIKPDISSDLSSKTYHPLSEFVKEFK